MAENNSQQSIKDMLRAIRAVRLNLEKFSAAARAHSQFDPDKKPLLRAADKLDELVSPTTAVFREIETKLEEWLKYDTDSDKP